MNKTCRPFNNDEFEDIYSNTPKKEKFKGEIPDDDFQDISSFSDDYGSVGEVKYNSSANNRRRQEFSYSDPDEVYGNMIPATSYYRRNAKHKRQILLATGDIFVVRNGLYNLFNLFHNSNF